MNEKTIDVAIIGAGAAGLMSAIWAGKTARVKGATKTVVLFDTKQKIGAKILMSGGTRSNVTNREVKPSDFQGGPSHFIKHVLEAFTPAETIRFFKDIGVEVILEPSGKYFPATHSAATVLNALIAEAKRAGVIFKTGVQITGVKKEGKLFRFETGDGTDLCPANRVIVATGGLSYPTTGSNGIGYQMARQFGHTVIETFPALTPLLTNDSDWKSLSGISLDVKLSLVAGGKKQSESQGSFLFTHFGFSGPAALDISGRYARCLKTDSKIQMTASFLPNEHEDSLRKSFSTGQKNNPKKLLRNFLIEEFCLPERLIEVFFKKIGANRNVPIAQCSNETKKNLIQFLLHYPLEVTGVFGYQKAEVTSGGVSLKEINVSTMESKLVEGLYFAGEVLDMDGRIGGFNFQWAWSTGAIAGQSAI